ncbi:hypothetical protein CIK59_18355 [Brevibacterium aurantiacum]|uniref:Uncharacterized protein n=1 Tax=Brevibacterium aurantiacum TaxID=273384 RepID=A0A2A3ZKN8_BREAU|nr:hypothetical protein CIK59_18355 [Brevibacterium aurantiacum]
MLAGITAKSNRLTNRVLVFFVLLVTSQIVYYFWTAFIGQGYEFSASMPYWITWFLLAMIWWLLLLPLVELFPKPMLVISIAVGAIGGIIPILDYEFTVARTLTFFPFFVIGKLYGKPAHRN